MRKQWTKAERISLSMLDRLLTTQGTRPMYCPDIVDSPDALFLIGGEKVAIECRYVTSENLMKFMGRFPKKDSVYEVVLPREPHLWVKDAIEDKNRKIEKYMANTGSTEAWLLLHSSPYHSILTNGDNDTITRTLLTVGTYLVKHHFTRIWFAELSNSSSELIEIFGPGIAKPSLDWDEYVATFTPDYPHDTYWFSPTTVQENDEVGKHTNINLNNLGGKPIGLQPLDPKYKLDYSYLSDPERHAGKSLTYRFYDNKPDY